MWKYRGANIGVSEAKATIYVSYECHIICLYIFYICLKMMVLNYPAPAKLIKNRARQYNYNKKKENNLY